jgi:hypothetical protein
MTLTRFTIDAARSIVAAGNVQLVGLLEGVATGGAYKVPARFVYPTGASPVVNAAIVEPWNNTNIERFGFPSGNDQSPPVMFSVLGAWMGYQFITETMGFSGISFEWNKDAIDQFSAAGAVGPMNPPTPTVAFDAAWVIALATDGYEIMADASTFARAPVGFLNDPFGLAPPAPPNAATAYMLGFSQTGAMVRGFIKDGHNSALGGTFPGGLVVDGSYAMGNGAIKRVIDNVSTGFVTYATDAAETPVGEGPFLQVATETDIFMAQTDKAKAAAPQAHYKCYEIVGSSHLNSVVPSYQDRWIDQLGQGLNPVVRGLIEALRQYVVSGTALPLDAWTEGWEVTRATAFSTVGPRGIQIPFGRSTDCRIPKLGDDGNILGGIRLPHVKTILGTGAAVGAPLGIHRGLVLLTQSLSSQTRADAIAKAVTPSPIYRQFGEIEMYQGFSAFYEPSLVAELYPEPDASKYAALVTAAADYALSQRWILAVDRDAYATFAGNMNKQDLINLVRYREVGPQTA